MTVKYETKKSGGEICRIGPQTFRRSSIVQVCSTVCDDQLRSPIVLKNCQIFFWERRSLIVVYGTKRREERFACLGPQIFMQSAIMQVRCCVCDYDSKKL